MKYVFLKWIDSAGSVDNIWQDDDRLITEFLPIQSAGILASEDSDSVTLVLSKTKTAFMGDITIPKVAIVFREDHDIAEG